LLGKPLLGYRLRDVRSVLRYLRNRADLDAKRMALWGDSFSQPNSTERNLIVPLEVDPFPDLAEPLGGLLGLFTALFEEDLRAVYVRGGLSEYRSILHSPFCYVPHDVLVPGGTLVGDLPLIVAALAPKPLRLEACVDGLNRSVPLNGLTKTYQVAREQYRSLKADSALHLKEVASQPREIVVWLLQTLGSSKGVSE
jgi:hypothetical protein